jgi:SPX domain protein involved in polyphosphate accumulation
MKFGLLLGHYRIPEFADKYLDYNALKKALKSLKCILVGIGSTGGSNEMNIDINLDNNELFEYAYN